MTERIDKVKAMLLAEQDSLCQHLSQIDGRDFQVDRWSYESGIGGGITKVLESEVIEKGGVNFSHIKGDALPPAATKLRPNLSGSPFEVLGISVVIHPKNPYAPTVHGNVRYFYIHHPDGAIWWFGGGVDLTPYYAHLPDCVAWHQYLKAICDPYGDDVYESFKQHCDAYFYLEHRKEARGIGGVFFDDLNHWGFDKTFEFATSILSSLRIQYASFLKAHAEKPYGERERNFQLYRRGRYVEFNLLYDRGTLFGIQSNGRTESILMSLPPTVQWVYDQHFDRSTPEGKLTDWVLIPKDWASFAFGMV